MWYSCITGLHYVVQVHDYTAYVVQFPSLTTLQLHVLLTSPFYASASPLTQVEEADRKRQEEQEKKRKEEEQRRREQKKREEEVCEYILLVDV